jgi:hypothetical protein
MARTAQEIQEQIEKLEQAMKVTRARNGIAHYRERISGLRGELMLLQAETDRQHGVKVVHIEDPETGGCIEFEYYDGKGE